VLRLDDRRAYVSVSDDGVGLPPDRHLGQNQSLGFQLIPSLVDQLAAEIQVVREQGTRFTIAFGVEGEQA